LTDQPDDGTPFKALLIAIPAGLLFWVVVVVAAVRRLTR
jgi:hypothetical protein